MPVGLILSQGSHWSKFVSWAQTPLFCQAVSNSLRWLLGKPNPIPQDRALLQNWKSSQVPWICLG